MFWKDLSSRKRLLLVISFLIIASIACSLPLIGGSTDPADPNTSGGDSSENDVNDLRCTQMGYPCTYADTPTKKIERGMDLMDLADEVFAQEGNAIAVAERLLEEDDIAEMYYDERGVWYRVEGAPPLVFLHPEALTYGLDDENPEQSLLTAKVLLSPNQPSGDGPVGENPPGEKVQKKALFVNPLIWQFGSSVYDSVKTQLQKYPDYKCAGCVEKFHDDVKAYDLIDEETQAAGPSFEQFLGWKEYDLIHVLAHGYQFCPGKSVTSSGKPVVSGDRENFPENTAGVVEGTNLEEGECVTMIQSGHYQTREYILENPRDVPGIVWFHKPGDDTWSEAITTDFFKSFYPGGLDDTILFFTSCQTMKDESLANTLKGSNTAVFGWTESVTGGRGKATAKEFFTELIDNGLRASVAYDKAIQSESHTEHSEDWHGAELNMVLDGGTDPRGREVVFMVQPVFREFLEENDALPAEGVAGDGEEDELIIMIQVDGVDEDQNLDDFEIHLALDGEELQKTFKPTDKFGDYSYRVIEIIPLSFDAAERDFVELEARVNLPEGGDARHYLEKVEIAGCGWTGTLSGGKSGNLKGEIVYPSSNITKANVEELTLLASQGMFGPGEESGMPSPSDFTNLPDYTIFGNRAQFPFMLLIPNQGGTVMLESSSFGVGPQVAINLIEDSQERVEGSFSVSVTNLMTQTGFSVDGDMVWHVDSFCSLDVILELAANPLPVGLLP